MVSELFLTSNDLTAIMHSDFTDQNHEDKKNKQ